MNHVLLFGNLATYNLILQFTASIELILESFLTSKKQPGNVSEADVLPGGTNQLSGMINQTSSSLPNSAMNLNNNLPERSDQPDCQHYMKTGSCKYGASCKYNHPKERNSLAQAPGQTQAQAQGQAQGMNAAGISGIGPLGFPLRPVMFSLFTHH
jgi:Zinc finger C-x8-C-x5-C-x3-H type (and similar)